MPSKTELLKKQIATVIPLLEQKAQETPSKFLDLLLKRYRMDLNLLKGISSKSKLHYGRFCIRGGYEALLISEVARDEELELQIQRAEKMLHDLLTAA